MAQRPQYDTPEQEGLPDRQSSVVNQCQLISNAMGQPAISAIECRANTRTKSWYHRQGIGENVPSYRGGDIEAKYSARIVAEYRSESAKE